MIKTTTTSPKETPSKKKSASAKKDVFLKNHLRKQSTAVQIRDTPCMYVSKKKALVTIDKRKGIDLPSEAALRDGFGSQPKVPDEPKDKKTGINKGTGTIPGVPDVPKDQSGSEKESWGESRDDDGSNDDDSDDVSDDDGNDKDNYDDGNDASDDERTESDEDESPNLNQNDDDKEEEYEEEYVHTPKNYESTNDENEHVNEEEYDRIDEELYKDVHAKLKDIDHGEEGKGDAEMTAIKTQVPVVVEAHLGTRLGNTIQQILPKEVSDFATPVIQSTVTESLENVVLAKSSSQSLSTYKVVALLTEFELKNILLDKMQKSQSYRGAKEHEELYDGLVKSYKLDKELFESHGKAYLLNRDHEDKDKDEDPPAGLD
ncbi:hypothetical protein Tco_1357756 [Tanacetum coccineum]